MALDIILYFLAVMIFYDFSLHALRLALGLERARKIKCWWPNFLTGKKNRRRYEIFWDVYWGIAFVLIVIYIFII